MIPSNLNRCRFEILENNKQTRESTALSVAYNVERWRRVGGDRGTSSARRNVDVSVQLVAKERMRPVAGLRTLGGRNYHKR